MHPNFCDARRWLLRGAIAAFLLATGTLRAQEAQPDCYILAVGVDAYRGPRVSNLKGCVNDARNSFQRFRQQEGKRFGKVSGKTLVDQEATKSAIDQELERMRGAGKAGDFVVVFLSGHGARPGNAWAFLPHDFDPGKGTTTAISGRQLLDLADTLASKGRKVLVIVDACFAGQLRLDARESLSKYQDPKGGGIILMLSSMPSQTSAALGSYSAFAQAVAEALAGEADLNGDGQVTLAEVRLYAYQRVYQLLKQRGMRIDQDGECASSLSISDSLVLVFAVKSVAGSGSETPETVAGLTGVGSETLAGSGKLTFRFHEDGSAVRIDARNEVNGWWSANGQEVTIRFRSCIYRGRLQGRELSGTAMFLGAEAGPPWSFHVTLQKK
jgi:hypothetical protein